MGVGEGECRADGRAVDGCRGACLRLLPRAGRGWAFAAGGEMADRLGRLGGDCEPALLLRGDTDGVRPDGQANQDEPSPCEDGVPGDLGDVLCDCVRLVLWLSVQDVRHRA